MTKPAEAGAKKRAEAARRGLETAARHREQERLAGIEARRLHARRAVLGLEAARLAAGGRAATAAWATERQKQLETLPQEPCWAILRPALGLEPETFANLMAQWRKTRELIRSGALSAPDQQLATRRKSWRQQRVRAWVRIARLILDNAADGRDTAATAISRCIDPRNPMP